MSFLSSVQSLSSVQLLSHVQLFATPWTAARQASLSITDSQSSLRLTSIESVMPSSHLILGHPFSSWPQSLPASESFPMSQPFPWGGQNTGVSASASFLPKKSQGWSPQWPSNFSSEEFVKCKFLGQSLRESNSECLQWGSRKPHIKQKLCVVLTQTIPRTSDCDS